MIRATWVTAPMSPTVTELHALAVWGKYAEVLVPAPIRIRRMPFQVEMTREAFEKSLRRTVPGTWL